MERLLSSFRDPSGFVFRREGILYRQINRSYENDYGRLIESGLYIELTASGALVTHEETATTPAEPADAFKVIRPREISFVSYPYEWCFSQLKDAALLTLDIQQVALEKGLCLKDASAFNIQFEGARPVHIDTLSFTTADSGPAWIAYRQFCQHFLAPLALMAHRDAGLVRLLALHPDGIPLDLACRILPCHTFLHFHRWLHLWFHNLGQRRAHRDHAPRAPASQRERLALVDSLRSAVQSLQPPQISSHWSQYEADRPSYSTGARTSKENFVGEMITSVNPKLLWDLGCNTGAFSQIAANHLAYAIASDYDHDCIETLYRRIRAQPGTTMLPLVIDFANPTPPVGWACGERLSFLQRGPADMILALAVIHHWALRNNITLPMIVDFFGKCTRNLLIEFVPKTDPMSRRLLANRADIFPEYVRLNFEIALAKRFIIRRTLELPESERVLYLCENQSPLC